MEGPTAERDAARPACMIGPRGGVGMGDALAACAKGDAGVRPSHAAPAAVARFWVEAAACNW